ncbi:MAG: hypothetical protein ACOC3D_05385 [Pseudomonadota bacterium]
MTTEAALQAAREFADRHGLDGLAPEHLARLAELAPMVAAAAATVPRLADKAAGPAWVLQTEITSPAASAPERAEGETA